MPIGKTEMGHPRVLIVDDEEGVRTSLGLILEDEGYRVQSVRDAHAALEAVEKDTFDVILCDVRMPGRSGLELLPDLVREQPDATVLMMSAFGEVDDALEAVRKGAYDFLSKPFQAEELLLVIRKAEERAITSPRHGTSGSSISLLPRRKADDQLRCGYRSISTPHSKDS